MIHTHGRGAGNFEIHIAGTRTDPIKAGLIFNGLQRVGMKKNKFFLSVYNVDKESSGCNNFALNTPPTGHDIAKPGFMSTAQVKSYDDARRLIIDGMEILDKYGIKGNFEIEHIICSKVPDTEVVDIKDFPGFREVEDSPKYENHLGWKGSLLTLPHYVDIIKAFNQRVGVAPHQFADFFETKEGSVSRIATIYQPSREAALELASRLQNKSSMLGHRYVLTEQVCLVGEQII